MTNGQEVKALEDAFAAEVGARYAIALINGTATLHTALMALGVKPGDRVAVPPLTMSSTAISVLHAGAVPVFVDVDSDTWLMRPALGRVAMPVSLYGLHYPNRPNVAVDDAAQTLRPINKGAAFTSYSHQASKILPLGEGGMLVTDSEELAVRAREFSSLGYRMRSDQPRIDPAVLKRPDYERHHALGWNYRMNDVTARYATDLMALESLKARVARRRAAATYYREAIRGCSWITPQHVPAGWGHDYWCFAVALESAELWEPFTQAVVRNGGEMPYGAWRLTYQEPAFRHCLGKQTIWGDDLVGLCPVAESLQPRLVQGQTNNAAAIRNADAWHAAIKEIGG